MNAPLAPEKNDRVAMSVAGLFAFHIIGIFISFHLSEGRNHHNQKFSFPYFLKKKTTIPFLSFYFFFLFNCNITTRRRQRVSTLKMLPQDVW
jgi:hypothetical protein